MARDIIMHSDLNCFYASVEVNENPSLAGKKVAVCGSTENRHGIVLTATYPAKRSGVKTGMANWEAKQVCPELIVVEPHYDLYFKYSRMVRRICRRYADDVEPFGLDESWLCLHGVSDIEGAGRRTAEEIRRTVRRETGLTVSVGVSFTKVFAKLGSDMKKPDAVTLITERNYRDRVWPLPASDLLYVGPATARKLRQINIHTIGELARCDPEALRGRLGKNGVMLWRFANGLDHSPVMPCGWEEPIKSIGHGVTCVRDLDDAEDVWRVIYALSQDIGHRLRKHHMRVRGVQLTVRDKELAFQQYQMPLPFPTRSPLEIARTANLLFQTRYPWHRTVRALTVRGIQVEDENAPEQLDAFGDCAARSRRQTLDDAVDEIRRRFGDASIYPASLMGPLNMADDRCETVPLPGMMYR